MSALASPMLQASSAAPVDISFATSRDAERWDAFVSSSAEGTLFHRFGWAQLARDAYGYEPLYLMATQGAEIVGVAPFVDVRAPLTGRALISTAFTTGGGVLAYDPSVREKLEASAVALGRALGVNYVELRNDTVISEGWREKNNKYVNYQVPLETDEIDAFNAIPRRRRADLRKALSLVKDGDVRIEHGNAPRNFYGLYARSLHRLGTPIFPRRFLHGLLDEFRDAIEFSFAYGGNDCVAVLLSFRHGDRILPYYIGAAPKARETHAVDLLYWAVMRRAAARGAHLFDFGRSKIGSGAARYKKLWGATEVPLSYHYYLLNADRLPDLSGQNPKFDRLSTLWRQTPSPIASALGPLLAPNFP
ncbi:MAG: FemAB family XrtA/PEP-CTERM system-associated protein [Pseudomonadota bacterium]